MEIIGSSPTSWEEAATTAVEKAGIHREDLRVAEVVEFDLRIDNQQVVAYRAKVKISYKYHEVVWARGTQSERRLRHDRRPTARSPRRASPR